MAELTTAQRSKIRRLSQPKELAPDEEGGELNIVPFLDIIMNILIFVLATVAVTFTATIDTTPPASKGSGVRNEIPSEALNLTVFIVGDGYALKASGGNIAPGCQGVGPGDAIPLKNGKYDPESLTACAARLKGSSPDFAEETQAYITANPGTAYQDIIDVMDALRTTPQGDVLFDNVNFKVSK
ncbi:MAG TPA: biopolymer transporter ExbD [Polyangiaceae bacterium]|jgi:biopolymer transport protein ExbD|nr:biopolymer transporter ExbD [Polyangiaceae bacterium]